MESMCVIIDVGDHYQYIQKVCARGLRGSDRNRIEADRWAALGISLAAYITKYK
jgi:hypothetical protein